MLRHTDLLHVQVSVHYRTIIFSHMLRFLLSTPGSVVLSPAPQYICTMLLPHWFVDDVSTDYRQLVHRLIQLPVQYDACSPDSGGHGQPTVSHMSGPCRGFVNARTSRLWLTWCHHALPQTGLNISSAWTSCLMRYSQITYIQYMDNKCTLSTE